MFPNNVISARHWGEQKSFKPKQQRRKKSTGEEKREEKKRRGSREQREMS